MRQLTPARWLERYGDDLAQEVVLLVLEAEAAGASISAGWYWYKAKLARRTVIGDSRRQWAFVDLEAALKQAAPARSHAGGFALARLQIVWQTLTELQREALLTVFDGHGAASERADELGVDVSSLTLARRRALERLDNPRRFTRSCKRGHVAAPDRAERRAAQRAYQRERARQLRAAQRAGRRVP